MTHTYALKRLLEHGPMTRCEIRICTGWKGRSVDAAISKCINQQLIRRIRRIRSKGPLRFAAVIDGY